MKTRIASLVLAAGLITAAALAESSPAIPVATPAVIASATPVPNPIAIQPHLPSAIELYGAEAEHEFAVRQTVASENIPDDRHLTFDGHAIAFSYRTHAFVGTGSVMTARPARTVVDSMPPSLVSNQGAYDRASWYPSITFRFDFGGLHGS